MGYQPPNIFNFVFAYKGPANMSTVCDWVKKSTPLESDVSASTHKAIENPSVDAVIVLDRGLMYFHNMPINFVTPQTIDPAVRWVAVDIPSGGLLYLFLLLTLAGSGTSSVWLDPVPYLGDFTIQSENLHLY